MKQVFPSLVPYNKLRTEFCNPQVGDIVLVHYQSQVSKGDYRLTRISAVHHDPHGIVRTVTVMMRTRDKREKVTANPPHLKPKPHIELSLGTQRLAVILPMEEQVQPADQSGPTEEQSLPAQLPVSTDGLPEVPIDPAVQDRHQADADLDASLSSETDQLYGFNSEAAVATKVKSRKYEDLQLDTECCHDDFEMNKLQKKLDVLRE